jgi:hypothetical protein
MDILMEPISSYVCLANAITETSIESDLMHLSPQLANFDLSRDLGNNNQLASK